MWEYTQDDKYFSNLPQELYGLPNARAHKSGSFEMNVLQKGLQELAGLMQSEINRILARA